MPKPDLTLAQVLSPDALFRLPRVVAFNRLEPRPRTLDFTRSLRAEMRDPLWLLTRQWQFGEFRGEDAASPVTSRIAYRHHAIDRLATAGAAEVSYDPSALPLEARVEREPVPLVLRELSTGEVYSDLLFAMRWGKQLRQRLEAAGLESHYRLYLEHFPIRVLPRPAVAGGPPRRVQDPEAEQLASAVAGRIADGVAIRLSVLRGTHDSWLDAQPGGDKPALKTMVATLAKSWSDIVDRLFVQPQAPDDSAWLPSRLEYRFTAAAAPEANQAQPNLLAEQYHQGHLDWYSFDASGTPAGRDGEAAEDQPVADQVESFLPAPVRFKGQPLPRFWQMEEARTDFGKIETSTTGLLHLMLAEFALIYSNDWFMLPHPMAINTVCEIRGILVDDSFGRHTFIRPAGGAPETAWQRFAMFHHSGREAPPSGHRFYLVPAVGKLLESAPLERVNFVRDEMANMAWGIESIVPSQTGIGMDGGLALSSGEAPPPPHAPAPDVKIRYVAGTTMPGNWIPFIPVHSVGSVSEVRLQRARMAGGEPPRGRLLREPRSPYFVEEEEVPRAGIYVERSWQRTRWLQGRTLIWVGRRKTAGRGEGWSDLVFDRIVDLLPPTA